MPPRFRNSCRYHPEAPKITYLKKKQRAKKKSFDTAITPLCRQYREKWHEARIRLEKSMKHRYPIDYNSLINQFHLKPRVIPILLTLQSLQKKNTATKLEHLIMGKSKNMSECAPLNILQKQNFKGMPKDWYWKARPLTTFYRNIPEHDSCRALIPYPIIVKKKT